MACVRSGRRSVGAADVGPDGQHRITALHVARTTGGRGHRARSARSRPVLDSGDQRLVRDQLGGSCLGHLAAALCRCLDGASTWPLAIPDGRSGYPGGRLLGRHADGRRAARPLCRVGSQPGRPPRRGHHSVVGGVGDGCVISSGHPGSSTGPGGARDAGGGADAVRRPLAGPQPAVCRTGWPPDRVGHLATSRPTPIAHRDATGWTGADCARGGGSRSGHYPDRLHAGLDRAAGPGGQHLPRHPLQQG